MGRNQAVAIQYHSFIADPFGIQYSDQRYKYYSGSGRPEAHVDGVLKKLGDGGDLVQVYGDLVRQRLEVPPAMDIIASGDVEGSQWTAEGTIEALQAIAHPASIRIAVLEDGLVNLMEVYDQVCRKGLEDIPVTALTPGAIQPFSVTFDLPGPVDPEKAQMLVWVQDDETTEVLQAKWISPVSLVMGSNQETVARGESLALSFELANISGETQAVEAWVDAYLPNGQAAPINPILGPTPLVLRPGASVSKTLSLPVARSVPLGTYELVARLGADVENVWEQSRLEVDVVP